MPSGERNDRPDDPAAVPTDLASTEAAVEGPAQGLPAVAPDAGEEAHADEMDDPVPAYGYHQLPVVGLGGSAGGIQALKTFFEALPLGTTVNHELKHNVEEAGHANSDLHNLMNATAIATVFLDRELKVLRYTPSAVPLFNLIPSDTGRPLGNLRHQVDYPELEEDARQVLRSLVPAEREVNGPDSRAFLARLQPYRTLEDRIAGVVLTFVDVTQLRRAEDKLRTTNDELSRFNKAAVGRESRMIELKKEVNNLRAQLKQPSRYVLHFENNALPNP